VAARVPYVDRITGKTIQPITTGQIYWGAVPFVCIQVLMIAITLAFPGMVTRYKGELVDPSTIEIVIPPFGGVQQPGGASSGSDLGQPPSFGAPPAGGTQQAPGNMDLTQPPKF
jgi:hypothetical protein